ncbi:hypothetical protein N7532_010080 [Penicillium argentinense]|uniref:Uncharacterized protein n=1 Tax=Penicillium argentinense TaxID=1131581 RepID=A0A9W9EP46_9EURO|nr:uncharacterized protein N7532_010080 [Penicillium argentinense]KAJ5085309.1 hypothetical protein N7532_010080 [Penicillium argentinense]
MDCFCYGSLRLLLDAHVAIQQDKLDAQIYPRTPKISNLLLLENDTNPVIQFLGRIMKRLGPATVVDTVAVYLIVYRLLRWRVYPVDETYQDIPVWYRPSTLQLTQPHALCIDFLAWPDLREYLISTLDPVQRVSFTKAIGESITVDWPSGREYLIRNDHGESILNSEFEEHIYEFKNWKLRRKPWGEKYPNLTHLVNIIDE